MWGLGIPVFCLSIMLKAKKENRLQSPKFRRRFGSIFKGFKTDYFFWDVFAMCRKFLLMCCAIFFKDTTGWQAYHVQHFHVVVVRWHAAYLMLHAMTTGDLWSLCACGLLSL